MSIKPASSFLTNKLSSREIKETNRSHSNYRLMNAFHTLMHLITYANQLSLKHSSNIQINHKACGLVTPNDWTLNVKFYKCYVDELVSGVDTEQNKWPSVHLRQLTNKLFYIPIATVCLPIKAKFRSWALTCGNIRFLTLPYYYSFVWRF